MICVTPCAPWFENRHAVTIPYALRGGSELSHHKFSAAQRAVLKSNARGGHGVTWLASLPVPTRAETAAPRSDANVQFVTV
jgi:hypothetical protein